MNQGQLGTLLSEHAQDHVLNPQHQRGRKRPRTLSKMVGNTGNNLKGPMITRVNLQALVYLAVIQKARLQQLFTVGTVTLSTAKGTC
ncbi:rCG20717 [Rattus norvegicus]|uniref:RCG20717 n=1 Tax=Rattus norvegicus TaxID=10116 RepID=A6JEI4_RAT|nr:rCG20717 [Rattus norvegicus]